PCQILTPAFEPATATARFPYALGSHQFVETVRFPALAGTTPGPADAHLLDLTAAALGTSYYKLLAPFHIDATALALTEADRAFVLDVYENGLGEFFARIALKRFGRLTLGTVPAPSHPSAPTLGDKYLVLI